MIQQKKATDDALVKRARKAVDNGDYSMMSVLEWDARGRKPKRKGDKVYWQARDVLVDLKKEHTTKELAKAFDTYQPLIYRIINEEYSQVPKWKAKVIASYDGEHIPKITDELEKKQADYRKAQKILQDQYTGTMTYSRLGAKYGLDKGETAKCIRDEYRNPHPNIIDKVLG